MDPKKNDTRSIFKKCFKNQIFSLVPFEIWRDLIVSNADLKSITILSQTCNPFRHLIGEIGENNFNLAWMLRKEGQISQARKFVLKCAENNNSTAMFHLGYAHYFSGWGFGEDKNKSEEWFKKSAELGNSRGMLFYAIFLSHGLGIEQDVVRCKVLAQKALCSNDSTPFVVALSYYSGLGNQMDYKIAFSLFEAAAKEGDEFAQHYCGNCWSFGHGTEIDYEKSFFWLLKSAEQGFCLAQHFVGNLYRFGHGCERDKEKSIIWHKKAANQGCQSSLKQLKSFGVY